MMTPYDLFILVVGHPSYVFLTPLSFSFFLLSVPMHGL